MNHARSSRFLGALVLVLATGLCSEAQSNRRKTAVKLELKLAKSAYMHGESIAVDVYLTNTGAAAVDVPLPGSQANGQPTYVLTGPGGGAATFSYRSVHFRQPSGEAAGQVAEAGSLAPGDQFVHGFRLNQWQDVSKPGSYRIRAQIEWKGLNVVSPEVTFEVLGNLYSTASLAGSIGVPDGRFLYSAWLGGGEARSLGRATFYLKRPDLGELTLRDVRGLRSVGADAADPFIPWTNFDPAEEALLRFGWREGGRLFLGGSTEAPPSAGELPGASARLVEPALMVRTGRVTVFALEAKGRQLHQVTFTPKEADPASFAVASRVAAEFPASVEIARATVARESEKSAPHVFAAANAGDKVLLMLWSESGGVRTVEVPGVAVWSASRPTVHVNPDGAVHASVCVRQGGAALRLAIVDAVFGPNAPEFRVEPLPEVADAVYGAAVSYEAAAAEANRRTWVIGLANGEVLHGGTAEPQALPAPFAKPLEFVVFHGQPFVLTLDPKVGPRLFALR